MALKLVVGAGYLGSRVAARWQREGARVIVTTRDPQRAAALAEAGYEVRIVDVTRPESLGALPPIDVALYCVAWRPLPYGPSRQALTVDGLQNLLDSLGELSDRLIYVSTTGVYGHRDAQWVDERSETKPHREAGQTYLAAEQLLQRHRWGDRSVILRMAGIYGPGRVPYLDRLRAGEPLTVDPRGYLNLIHVEDAAEVVVASERVPLPNRFVVSDGTPVLRGEYYAEAARLVGGRASFGEIDPAGAQAQRAQGSKRIRTDKMKSELCLELAYPSYREGLAAILTPDRG